MYVGYRTVCTVVQFSKSPYSSLFIVNYFLLQRQHLFIYIMIMLDIFMYSYYILFLAFNATFSTHSNLQIIEMSVSVNVASGPTDVTDFRFRGLRKV